MLTVTTNFTTRVSSVKSNRKIRPHRQSGKEGAAEIPYVIKGPKQFKHSTGSLYALYFCELLGGMFLPTSSGQPNRVGLGCNGSYGNLGSNSAGFGCGYPYAATVVPRKGANCRCHKQTVSSGVFERHCVRENAVRV